MGFDWKKALATAAPMLGATLGGPLGGAAAKFMVQKLNLQKDGKPVDPTNQADFESAMADALLNPEQVVQLKLAEQQHVENMAQLGFKTVTDIEKINADDRANARAMQISTRSIIVPVIALVIVVGFLALLSLLLLGKMHVTDQQALILLLGGLSTSFTAVVMFYFGSSSGSERKTELLAQGSATK